MPGLANSEWKLRRSRQQDVINTAALLLPFLVLAGVSANFLWIFLTALILIWPCWWLAHRLPECEAIGCDEAGQWWLQRAGKRKLVRWRSGSLRRADLLVLYPSPWPWQGLVVRRQHCASDDDFRRLKMALYSSM